jgi:hypothetical protein
MADPIRRAIDKDVEENLDRFRRGDFESALRKKLAGGVPASSPIRHRRILYAAGAAAAGLAVAAVLVIFWPRRAPAYSVSAAAIESALHAAPGWPILAAGTGDPETRPAESAMGRTLAAILEKSATCGSKRTEEATELPYRTPAAPQNDLDRSIEILIRDHVIERVLIKYSSLNKEG